MWTAVGLLFVLSAAAAAVVVVVVVVVAVVKVVPAAVLLLLADSFAMTVPEKKNQFIMNQKRLLTDGHT